jgi:hypothetical protein
MTDKLADKNSNGASPPIGKRLEGIVHNLAEAQRRLEKVDEHLDRARAAERAAGVRA